MQGLLLFDQQESLDSFSLLFHTTPLMSLWLLAAAAFWEPRSLSVIASLARTEQTFLLIMLINCGSAFACNLLSLCVTAMTSPLTLEVCAKSAFIALLMIVCVHPVGASQLRGSQPHRYELCVTSLSAVHL